MLDVKDKNVIIFIIALIVVFISGFFIGKATNKGGVSSNNEEIMFLDEEVENIKVYITGEINNSGVYELKKGSRVIDLIKLAGDLTEDGDLNAINPARTLKDGESITIPKKILVNSPAYEDAPSNNISTSQSGKTKEGLININKASKAELMELYGIGDVKAQAIIDYREENGSFVSIEDIKEVPGIGDKTFEKIKDKITVD